MDPVFKCHYWYTSHSLAPLYRGGDEANRIGNFSKAPYLGSWQRQPNSPNCSVSFSLDHGPGREEAPGTSGSPVSAHAILCPREAGKVSQHPQKRLSGKGVENWSDILCLVSTTLGVELSAPNASSPCSCWPEEGRAQMQLRLSALLPALASQKIQSVLLPYCNLPLKGDGQHLETRLERERRTSPTPLGPCCEVGCQPWAFS